MKKKDMPSGVVLFRGRSPFANNQPFAVIAILGKSANKKTGNMIQIYIILDSMKATDSIRTGDDEAVCGDCPLRGLLGKVRTCYVNLGQGPRSVFEGYQRGIYPDYEPSIHDELFMDRYIRFGAYGEPVLIPVELVEHLATLAAGHTGYSHQFGKPQFQVFRKYFMASTHTESDRRRAESLGWRWFNTVTSDERLPGAIVCPASAEAGKRATCAECRACNGSHGDNDRRKNIQIQIHGGFGQIAASKKLAILN